MVRLWTARNHCLLSAHREKGEILLTLFTYRYLPSRREHQKRYWAKSTGSYIRAISQVPAKLVDHTRLCFQKGYFPIFRYPLC